jgi:hypothetical protein
VNAEPSDGNLSSPITIDDPDVDMIEIPPTKLDVEADLSRFINLTTQPFMLMTSQRLSKRPGIYWCTHFSSWMVFVSSITTTVHFISSHVEPTLASASFQ